MLIVPPALCLFTHQLGLFYSAGFNHLPRKAIHSLTHSRRQIIDVRMIPNDYGWEEAYWLVGCARRHAGAQLKGLSVRCVTHTFSGAFRCVSPQAQKKRCQRNRRKKTVRVTNYGPLAIIRVVEILNYSRFTFAYTERCLKPILRPKHEPNKKTK